MTTQNPEPEWLTVKDVAEVLQVAPMTVYRIINSGQLPALRLAPRSIRVKREHLDAWVESQTHQHAADRPVEPDTDQQVEEFLYPVTDPALVEKTNFLKTALEGLGVHGVGWQLIQAMESLDAAEKAGRFSK